MIPETSKPKASKEPPPPLTFDVPEAGAMAGLGRSASYRAAAAGLIPTISLGRKKRVPAKRWLKILNGDG